MQEKYECVYPLQKRNCLNKTYINQGYCTYHSRQMLDLEKEKNLEVSEQKSFKYNGKEYYIENKKSNNKIIIFPICNLEDFYIVAYLNEKNELYEMEIAKSEKKYPKPILLLDEKEQKCFKQLIYVNRINDKLIKHISEKYN